MDRNVISLGTINRSTVALRKESVDRNTFEEVPTNEEQTVALRKESVDRNVAAALASKENPVALRKESVDRNNFDCSQCPDRFASLSARRAWIEIFYYADKDVDWVRRSPQGERG